MLPIDLSGKRAFVAGVADDGGFGFAIAKALAQAGASVCVGTWPPALGILETLLRRGKLDASLQMPDGSKMELEKIYPLDAEFDSLQDAPQELREQQRYRDRGDIPHGDRGKRVFVRLARAAIATVDAPGWLVLGALVPREPGGRGRLRRRDGLGKGGARNRRADVGVRDGPAVGAPGQRDFSGPNVISAGPYASRAASAIGFIHKMIAYYEMNAPLPEALRAEEVGNAAAFLCSPLASGITGTVLYVDKGYHAMAAPADVAGLVDSLSGD
jgi:enoyl-[acyl-carrier protein] reductase I